MAATYETVAAEAHLLSKQDQIRLAHELLDIEDVPTKAEAEIEAAWNNETRRRMEEYRAGNVTAIPSSEVHAQISMLLNK